MLAAHERPDGDALGSLVGMQGLLSALGKDSVMFIAPDDLPLPLEYRFFALEGLIQTPPADVAERTVVFLDCGNIDRNSASVLHDGRHLLNIDHHHDNTRFGTLDYVVPDASCTAEIVWDLMRGLGVRPTPAVAEALYVGLITDTGRFMYENTGPRAHEMAADLIGGRRRRAGRVQEAVRGGAGGQAGAARAGAQPDAPLRLRRADAGGAERRRTSPRPAPRRATRRASSTICARCRARSSRRSCAS